MNDLARPDAWTQANQRLLVAELARLRQRLRADPEYAAPPAAELQSARAALSPPAAIDRLTDRLGLSPFERDVLLLCAGVELDATLAALCESDAGEARRHGASFGLALAVLEAPHWSALAPVGPLRRWRLVELDDATGLARGPLRIDPRVLDHLAGVDYLDPRLADLLRAAPAPSALAGAHREVADALQAAIETSAPSGRPPLAWLTGDDPAGQASGGRPE
ncbi:MAG: ATP-binding protein, partial [Comamonadaceae bacterium]